MNILLGFGSFRNRISALTELEPARPEGSDDIRNQFFRAQYFQNCLVRLSRPAARAMMRYGAATDPDIGIMHSVDHAGPSKARIFGGGLLIAAEEARSCAGGQHAQALARADALRARPRPALPDRREQ